MEDLVQLLLNLLLGVVVLGFPCLLWVLHSSSNWKRTSKSGARLPEGSMGWPIIGETLMFSQDHVSFYASRIQRYGSVFKTSLFGKPYIVGTTPEFTKFILSQSNIFHNSSPPPSLQQLTGPKSFLFRDGPAHVNVKKFFQKGLQPESLRLQMETLESTFVRNLDSWAEEGSLISRYAAKKITLEIGLYLLTGVKEVCATPEGQSAMDCLRTISNGLVSVPVNLPVTAFGKGIKARESLKRYFQKLLDQRRGDEKTSIDILGSYLTALKDPDVTPEVKNLSDDEITDNLTALWFGSYDTVSSTLVWILKLLFDNPDVRLLVQAEQEEIRKSKERSGESTALTWEDTRKMVYTAKFLLEVNRYISIATSIFRTASQDMEFEGFLIPKGWSVAISVTNHHFNPAVYPDPFKFDPTRFDKQPTPYMYMPFGKGTHVCPGFEFSKLMKLIFIHHITTTFTYESAAPDTGSVYDCIRIPRGGYPIKFRRND